MNCPGLSRWVQCNRKGPYERQRDQKQRKQYDKKAETQGNTEKERHIKTRKLNNATLLNLKMREEATNKGIERTSKSGQRQENSIF